MLDANSNPALLPVCFLLPLRERMIARRTDVDAAAKAAGLEPRLSLSRAISAVGKHIRGPVGFVQQPIQLLAVVDCRIAHVIAPDQLVRSIRIHMVLVAVKVPPVLLRPACILVLLPVFAWLLLPRLGRLATLDRFVLLPCVPLFGHRHDGGIDDLSAARDIALRAEMPVEAIEQLFNDASLGELLAEQPQRRAVGDAVLDPRSQKPRKD